MFLNDTKFLANITFKSRAYIAFSRDLISIITISENTDTRK